MESQTPQNQTNQTPKTHGITENPINNNQETKQTLQKLLSPKTSVLILARLRAQHNK